MHLPRLKKLYEQTAGTSWPTGITKPSGVRAPLIGLDTPKEELDDLFRRYIPQLKKVGINVSDNAPVIGKGTGLRGRMGIAYDLGSTVLKITADRSEANACVRIKGKKLDNVYEIYDVYELDSYHTFAIHQEKLKPTEPQIQETWGAVIKTLNERGSESLETCLEMLKFNYNYYFKFSKLNPKFFELLVKAFKDVFNGLQELKANGIIFTDFNVGNVLKRGNDYVIIDIGASKSGQKPIDKLE